MKTIKVEVTEAQARYIHALSRQMGPQSDGDFLLAAAFAGLGLLQGNDGRVETLVDGLNQFVVRRRLPSMEEDGLFEYGISSRPANSPRTKETLTETLPAIPAGRN